MRTLQFGLRVADRSVSVAFYTTLGYEVIGEVPESPIGHLTMLKLPGDEFVSLELVHNPAAGATSAPGFSHFAVHVESLDEIVARLQAAGIHTGPRATPSPDMHTTTITDPDGREIELVQWPPGHPDGLSGAKWADSDERA
jgi:lactoylglutathione lyase